MGLLDVTFGNAIGQAATETALEDGWAVTNWLMPHAETLGVEYLIRQAGDPTTAAACTTPPMSPEVAPTTSTSQSYKEPEPMDTFPDFGGVGGANDLRAVIGALLRFVLIISVLMLIICAITWAIADGHH